MVWPLATRFLLLAFSLTSCQKQEATDLPASSSE